MTIESRSAARALILGLEWDEESLIATKAEQWVLNSRRWVTAVKWGQWEGLRRRGEGARRWEEYRSAIECWLSDAEKAGRPARRAWDHGPLRPGEECLKDSLLKVIEEASRPGTRKNEALVAVLEDAGFSSGQQTEIDQFLRVQRARKFVELLSINVRIAQESERVREELHAGF